MIRSGQSGPDNDCSFPNNLGIRRSGCIGGDVLLQWCVIDEVIHVTGKMEGCARIKDPVHSVHVVLVRADLGGHLKYSQRWSGVCAGVLLGAQGTVRRGENRGEL